MLERLGQLSFALALAVTAASAQPEDRVTRVAEQLRGFINAGDFEGIQSLFNERMSEAMPLPKTMEFFRGLRQQQGDLERLGAPRRQAGLIIFPAHFAKGVLDLRLALDGRGKIAGLYFLPHTPPKPAPAKHQTRLSLPFADRWLVFWGGDTSELNQHHNVPNQKFAFDLLGVDEQGRTRRGNGNGNEDFFAFGREVLAPAAGTVVEAIDGVRDNTPGSMNPFSALGNAVVLQHRENEVSVLAHFKQGSVRVKAGDTVKRGQVLGLCGNSGNSSEPHIHYHLQHSPIIQDGLGIKVLFDTVVVTRSENTETKHSYSPVKGDIIIPE